MRTPGTRELLLRASELSQDFVSLFLEGAGFCQSMTIRPRLCNLTGAFTMPCTLLYSRVRPTVVEPPTAWETRKCEAPPNERLAYSA